VSGLRIEATKKLGEAFRSVLAGACEQGGQTFKTLSETIHGAVESE
jgi:hypothetical protein